MPAPVRKPISCWRANSFAVGVRPPKRRSNRPPRKPARRKPTPRTPAMSQPPKPRGLGRGLSALLGDEDVAVTVTHAPPPEAPRPAPAPRTPFTLPIAHLRAGPFQPRTTFEDLESLIESIRQFGLLQPILVR